MGAPRRARCARNAESRTPTNAHLKKMTLSWRPHARDDHIDYLWKCNGVKALVNRGPNYLHFIRRLALRANGARARDSTVYGVSSTIAKSFFGSG